MLFRSAVLFLDMSLGDGAPNQISRADGIVVILFFLVFLYYLITLAKQKKEENKKEKPKYGLGRSMLFIALGLAGIIIGSEMVVQNASSIAMEIGMSERVIALTVIAFGTSLPELVTTIVASRKGEQDLVVGNIIGSNIFNICIVLGVPVAIFGAVTPASFQMVDIVMLVASSALLFIFAVSTRRINRIEGALMIALFAAYYTYIVLA